MRHRGVWRRRCDIAAALVVSFRYSVIIAIFVADVKYAVGDAEPSPVFLAVRVAECCSYLSNFDELFVQLLDELLVWWLRHTIVLH